MVKIGIIGGSGLENPDILQGGYELEVNTVYGKPSSALKIGRIGDIEVVLLSRHGIDHSIPPSKVNFRANIQALKDQGVTHLVVSTACGSLREEIKPGDLVFVDQFIDRTSKRECTFFDADKVVHTPMSEPFCGTLRNILIESARELGINYHPKGTMVTIEGPRFSTKAESQMFRCWGADVINMSTVPEVILAREAGMCYAAVAMSTDYDCWKDDEEPVTFAIVMQRMAENADKVIKLFLHSLPKIQYNKCSCQGNEEEEGQDKGEDIVVAIQPKTILDGFGQAVIKSAIRDVPDFPKPGIMFHDVTTLLLDPQKFKMTVDKMVEYLKDKGITKIVGIESRGFILASAIAYNLGVGVVLARKPGKLPAEVLSQEYDLEYGTDKIEIHTDALYEEDKISVIDDLCATCGAAKAACELLERLGAQVAAVGFIIDMPDLKGSQRLSKYDVFKLVDYLGE